MEKRENFTGWTCYPIGSEEAYAAALLSQLFKIIIRFSLICGRSLLGVVLLLSRSLIGRFEPKVGGVSRMGGRSLSTVAVGGEEAVVSVVWEPESIEDV